jgi:hypothetical protein
MMARRRWRYSSAVGRVPVGDRSGLVVEVGSGFGTSSAWSFSELLSHFFSHSAERTLAVKSVSQSVMTPLMHRAGDGAWKQAFISEKREEEHPSASGSVGGTSVAGIKVSFWSVIGRASTSLAGMFMTLRIVT